MRFNAHLLEIALKYCFVLLKREYRADVYSLIGGWGDLVAQMTLKCFQNQNKQTNKQTNKNPGFTQTALLKYYL